MRYNIDEILAMAEQIERNGASFYRRGARIVREPQVVQLMEELARWEEGHESLFAQMRTSLGSVQLTLLDPEDQADLYLSALAGAHVFGPDRRPEQLLRGDEGADEILALALRFEADSINFFAAMRSSLPEGERARVDALIQEELGHVAFIERTRRRLLEPERG